MTWELPLLGRLLLAAILGAVIGAERDLHARPAGLRTNMIIAVGACLFAIISSEGYADASGTQDPTRIASIVVQGIGFIGAGVLLKGDKQILGLTTAASIWLAAAVGLACGAGMLTLAAAVTVGSVTALFLLGPVSARLAQIGRKRMLKKGGEIVRDD